MATPKSSYTATIDYQFINNLPSNWANTQPPVILINANTKVDSAKFTTGIGG